MTQRIGKLVMCGLLLSVLLTANNKQANAAILYSNFDIGDEYNKDTGWHIGKFGSNTFDEVAFSFIVQGIGDYTLQQIDAAVSIFGDPQGPNTLTLNLISDFDNLPNDVIESIIVDNAMGPFHALNPPIFAPSVLHPVLQAGNKYWLSAVPASFDTSAAWNINGKGIIGDRVGRIVGQTPWAHQVADDNFEGTFRILGEPVSPSPLVPEPTSILLLGIGLAGLGVQESRRRFFR